MGARRARPEEIASALSMYADGVYITEIAKRTGFGTTTIFRWATEYGIAKSKSDRLSHGSARRQCGREHLGKKGGFHTSKGGAWISTDSNYEQCRLEQLEKLPSVSRICRCRFRVPYFFDGKKRTYSPDFEVELADGSLWIEEVKPERMKSAPKVAEKHRAAKEFFDELGIPFFVVTEECIGLDRLKAYVPSGLSHSDEDYRSDILERRRLQKNSAMSRYRAKQMSRMTPELLEKRREYGRNKQREYRAREKAKNNTA